MKEQDIRKVLKDVCDSLDRQRAKAGPLAMGAMIAMATACGPGVPRYAGTFEETSTTVLDSSVGAPDYSVSIDGGSDIGAGETDVVDTSDADAAEDGDGDAPIDLGGAALYAVIMDSQTSENQGG